MALVTCFHDGGFAGFWWGNDQATLATTNGGDQVYDAGGQGVGIRFQIKTLVGEDGG